MTFGPIRTERLLLGPVGRTSRGTAARAEIGHSLAPAVWGPGYATNTFAAVCARHARGCENHSPERRGVASCVLDLIVEHFPKAGADTLDVS